MTSLWVGAYISNIIPKITVWYDYLSMSWDILTPLFPSSIIHFLIISGILNDELRGYWWDAVNTLEGRWILGQLPDPTVIVLGLHAGMCHVDISLENLTNSFSAKFRFHSYLYLSPPNDYGMNATNFSTCYKSITILTTIGNRLITKNAIKAK